jgi:hypothetical protein
MMPASPRTDRVFRLTCLVGGSLLVLGCALTTIEIGQSAFIGAGEAQRGFDYDRTVHFVTYPRPGSLLHLLGGIALVACGLPSRPRPAVVLVAAAISVAFVLQAPRISDELQWVNNGGVIGCETKLAPVRIRAGR